MHAKGSGYVDVICTAEWLEFKKFALGILIRLNYILCLPCGNAFECSFYLGNKTMCSVERTKKRTHLMEPRAYERTLVQIESTKDERF